MKAIKLLTLAGLFILSSCASVSVNADYDKKPILADIKPMLILEPELIKQKFLI